MPPVAESVFVLRGIGGPVVVSAALWESSMSPSSLAGAPSVPSSASALSSLLLNTSLAACSHVGTHVDGGGASGGSLVVSGGGREGDGVGVVVGS